MSSWGVPARNYVLVTKVFHYLCMCVNDHGSVMNVAFEVVSKLQWIHRFTDTESVSRCQSGLRSYSRNLPAPLLLIEVWLWVSLLFLLASVVTSEKCGCYKH